MMKTLATKKVKNLEEALKYAHAFMRTDTLNMKEVSFINPKPTQFNNDYLFPTDMYSATYSETVPTWELFKNNKEHTSSPGFMCVGCLDKKDQKRVNLSWLNGDFSFSFYGNYEDEAKKAYDSITSIYSTLD